MTNKMFFFLISYHYNTFSWASTYELWSVFSYKYRNSDYAVDAGCNESCEKDLLCNMVNTMNGDTTRCEELKNLYEENL